MMTRATSGRVKRGSRHSERAAQAPNDPLPATALQRHRGLLKVRDYAAQPLAVSQRHSDPSWCLIAPSEMVNRRWFMVNAGAGHRRRRACPRTRHRAWAMAHRARNPLTTHRDAMHHAPCGSTPADQEHDSSPASDCPSGQERPPSVTSSQSSSCRRKGP